MEFSILLPTWNNLDLLKLCVESIRKNSRFKHEIILHINEGTDGTLEWAEQEKTRDPLFHYTYSKKNSGICFALNAASHLANKDFVAYIHDDMYCCPDWDKYLAEVIVACGEAPFCLSSTMIERRHTRNPCVVEGDFGDSPLHFKEAALLDACRLGQLNRSNWLGSTWTPLVMRTSSWRLVGGLSTEYFPGMSSDDDLSMKLWHSGCRIFIGVGKSLAYHFMSKSNVRVQKNPGRQQFLNKWGLTQSTFNRHYLRKGEPSFLITPLSDPKKNLRFYGDLMRGWLKTWIK